MGKEEFLTGLAAAVIALSALMFAIFQAAAAFSMLMSAVSRCDQRVTGAFDLRAGFWLSILTLTPDVKYRMPVITMPGLRSGILAMETIDTPQSFLPGLNFKNNAYVDGKRARIFGEAPDQPPGPISVGKTTIRILRNIIWAPFAIVFSTVACLACWPAALFCGGCGGPGLLAFVAIGAPLYPLTHNVRRKKGDDIERRPDRSPNPDLEPASWVQFLLANQTAWWGHADIRWEWRLASAIPQDLPGATIESTVADLELLSLLFGMVRSSNPKVMARSSCGEEIVLNEHPALGRLAYYRSGRENINRKITELTPDSTSPWLRLCIEVAQKAGTSFPRFETPCLPFPGQHKPEFPHDPKYDVIGLLSRQRSSFDAQLQFSCGQAMWLFSEHGFLSAQASFLEIEQSRWSQTKTTVYQGPIGSGINSCSCVTCCRAWFSKHQKHWQKPWRQWALLEVHVFEDRICTGSLWRDRAGSPVEEDSGPGHDVDIHTRKFCRQRCAIEDCTCGLIAKVPHSNGVLPLKETIAALAINTKWLSKAPRLELQYAAESMLLGVAANPATEIVWNVSLVMAYTEGLLFDVRRLTGATNMWNTPVRDFMSDYSIVSMG